MDLGNLFKPEIGEAIAVSIGYGDPAVRKVMPRVTSQGSRVSAPPE